MSVWKTYKLKDLYIEPSKNGLTKPSSIRGNGYKMVNMKEIFSYDRIFDIPMERVPVSEKEERFFLQSGDLLFARQSLVVSGAGKCSIFLFDKEPVVFESHLIRTRFNVSLIDSNYLYYYFKSPIGRNKIESIVEFTAAAGIRGSDLSMIEIKIPDLNTQTQIAQILTSLDDKIEINLQMNQTLEAMAQAIFKEWFVDFKFPGFDGELVEGLPKGWSECLIKDYGKIICGKTPSKAVDEYFGGEYMFIKIPDMHNSVFVIETTDSLTELGLNSQSNKTIPPFSICISSIATVGLVCINPKPCQTNQQINTIVPKNNHLRYFLYFLTTSMKDTFLATASGGTATLNMNTSQFSSIGAIMPNDEILKKFDEVVSPIMEKILENEYNIKSLTQTRDSLLPRLMSGKIEVKG